MMGFSFSEIFSQIVKNWDDSQFWHDNWVGTINLKMAFWKWKSCPIVAGLSHQLQCLSDIIAPVRLQPGQDPITCVLAPDGKYKVELLRKKIEQKVANNTSLPQIIWSKTIAIKVTSFI